MNLASVLLLICWLAAGCASYETHAARRTAGLREMYPPGTSRQEVQRKWKPVEPDFSAARPGQGWRAYPNDFIARKLAGVEVRTGKRVALVERYWGPDGFVSLCWCWYFYDSTERVIDVEWQYKSD
ncbi:hypothetical protein [Haloferula sargassicola]|uniref:Lipoprotein n=1 Tax=Haloferula sargassicola TaxID=490096 RepID=A0ABP9ULT6_9BACT